MLLIKVDVGGGEVVAELEGNDARAQGLRLELRHRDVDDLRTRLLHPRQRRPHDRRDWQFDRVAAEELLDRADTHTAERVRVERLDKMRHRSRHPRGCRRVVAVETHGGIEGDREVRDGPRQRSGDILRGGQRDDAMQARDALGRPQSDERVERGGDADRSACVRAPADGGKARGDGRAGPAARSSGVARRVVGIPGLTAERTERRDPDGEFHQVRLAEQHRAGGAEFRGNERITAGRGACQTDRSRAGRQVLSVVIVFEDDGDAVQRTAGTFRLALLIERGGFRSGSRVQPDQRVEDGALLIVGCDPVQVHADQRFGRDTSGCHSGLQLLNRRFPHTKGGVGRGGNSRCRGLHLRRGRGRSLARDGTEHKGQSDGGKEGAS